jgi:carbamoylphosphate synthase small subunit
MLSVLFIPKPIIGICLVGQVRSVALGTDTVLPNHAEPTV